MMTKCLKVRDKGVGGFQQHTHIHVLSLYVTNNKRDFATVASSNTTRTCGCAVCPCGKDQTIPLMLCCHVVIVIQFDTAWKTFQTLGATEVDSFVFSPNFAVILENV